jgi:hypothetical protein
LKMAQDSCLSDRDTMPSTVAADNESLTSYLRQRFIVSKADVKCSNDTLFCVSSPEKIRSFDPGPKIASGRSGHPPW